MNAENPFAAARTAARSARPVTVPSQVVAFPPTAEQSAILDAFRRGEDMVITAGAGTGKALRDDQRVQTPYGPVPISKIKVGDQVIGSSGRSCSVTGVYPQGVRDLYTVTTCDGVEIVADDDHIWTVGVADPNRPTRRTKTPVNLLTTEVAAKLDEGMAVMLPVLRAPVCNDDLPVRELINMAEAVISRRVGDIATIAVPNVDQFVALVQALGGVATVHTPRTPGYPAVPVYVQCPILGFGKETPVRRIVRVERTAPGSATCISVDSPDSLYATEGFVLTHNTSTIQLLAQDMTKTDPSGRGVYLAFNRSISKEMQTKVPYNVTASTLHSLAYRACMKIPHIAPLMAKLNAEKTELMKPLDRPKVFGVPQLVVMNPDSTGDQEVLQVNGATVCAAALRAMDSFCQSAYTTIQPECVNYQNLPMSVRNSAAYVEGRKAFQKYVAALAQKMWDEDVTNVSGRLRFSPDFYWKLYALTSPSIAKDQGISGRAVLFFDEAQDSQACITDLILKQRGSMQIIVCGDSSQSIYRFRGSVDSLKAFADSDKVSSYALSQTFRFGPEIARRANRALNHLPLSDVRIVPDVSKNSAVEQLPADRNERNTQLIALAQSGRLDACVCQSNYDVLSVSIALVAAGVKTYAEIDQRAVTNAANDYQRMARGERAFNPALRQFTDLDHLKRVISPRQGTNLVPEDNIMNYDIDDVTVSVLRMIMQFGTKAVLGLLSSMVSSENQADVILSTVHKSKGRQWGKVAVLWGGSPFNPRGNADPYSSRITDELMVWYVAVTRAQEVLYIAEDPCVAHGRSSYADDVARTVSAICGSLVTEDDGIMREVREKSIKGYQLSAAVVFAHKMFAYDSLDSNNGKLTKLLLMEVGVEAMLAAKDIHDSGIPIPLVRCMTPLTNAAGKRDMFTKMFGWGDA